MRAGCGASPSPPVTGGKNLSSLFVPMGQWLIEPALASVRWISHNRIYRMSRDSASRQFVQVEGMIQLGCWLSIKCGCELLTAGDDGVSQKNCMIGI